MRFFERLRYYRFNVYLYFLLPQLSLFTLPFEVADLGFWIGLGREILEKGEIVTQDSFSVLKTYPMIYPSWGISVIYALLDKLGGIELIFVFHRAVFLLFQWIIFTKIRYFNFNNPKFFLLILMAIVGASYYVDRTAMFGMIFLVLVNDSLVKIFSQNNYLKNIIILYVVITTWANVHGSVFFAYIYCGMFVLHQWSLGSSSSLRKVVYVLGAVFLGTISNPFGFDIYPYAIETARISKQRSIPEWASPTLPTKESFIEVLSFYFLGLLDLKRRFAHSKFKSFLHPITLTFLFGITALRNVVLFFWVYLINLNKESFENDNKLQAPLTRIEVAFVSFLFIGLISLVPPFDQFTFEKMRNFLGESPSRYRLESPKTATDEIIKDGQNGAIFNEFEFGGYLIYRLGGKNKIFMDGRNIIYSQDDFMRYKKALLSQKDEYKELFSQYNFRYVILHKRKIGLGIALKSDPNYRELYNSEDTLVFVKND